MSWIPIDKGIPEFGEFVLIWNGWAIMQAALSSQANGLEYWVVRTLQIGQFKVYRLPYEDVTHWHPSLEVPK